MADRILLPNPLSGRAKAPRDGHPSQPAVAETPRNPTPRPAVGSNRLGPNRVRKSMYLPADTAQRLSELMDQVHHDSRGAVSKAEAAGALIRLGLVNLDLVYAELGVPRSDQ